MEATAGHWVEGGHDLTFNRRALAALWTAGYEEVRQKQLVQLGGRKVTQARNESGLDPSDSVKKARNS